VRTYILTWNAEHWNWDTNDRDQAIKATDNGKPVPDQWSTGNRKTGITDGDRAFLLQQGHTRGMVASGTFRSDIFQGPHWDGSGNEANYARVDWDLVLSDDDMLPTAELNTSVEGVAWDNILASGIRIPDQAAAQLETLWAQRYETFQSPEEVGKGALVEGAARQVVVNKYERNPVARKACIDHYGPECQVCGLDFGARYGTIGDGFIHVHHLVDIASIGKEYQVNPIEDLRPVCPNCHAMLHTTKPAMSIGELKNVLNKQE
jgi:5-methylcytosine-specific restriction protein A